MPWFRHRLLIREERTAEQRISGERALKRVAIGRKNRLFAGNDAFGQHHATLWTLIASAERHGIDPERYLRSVLAKIGQTPLR